MEHYIPFSHHVYNCTQLILTTIEIIDLKIIYNIRHEGYWRRGVDCQVLHRKVREPGLWVMCLWFLFFACVVYLTSTSRHPAWS